MVLYLGSPRSTVVIGKCQVLSDGLAQEVRYSSSSQLLWPYLSNLDVTWKEISQCSIGADLVIYHKTYSTLRAHTKIKLSIIFADYFLSMV